jgi:hypothetical protein
VHFNVFGLPASRGHNRQMGLGGEIKEYDSILYNELSQEVAEAECASTL